MSFEKIPLSPAIPTYVINLLKRPERRKNILKQFAHKSEFSLTIVEAFEDPFGAMGLWKTLCSITNEALLQNHEYILVCEDDHTFTTLYSERKLRESIEKAKSLEADILLGGVSWSGDSIMIDKSLFWTRSFSGLQFVVIFQKFYQILLQAPLENYDAADHYICDLSRNIFFIHPFISKQRSYPYSDVTPANNERGRVKQLFLSSELKIKKHKVIAKRIHQTNRSAPKIEPVNAHETVISTYIINLKERPDRKEHITDQFFNKKEFELNWCEGERHSNGQIGLWKSIRKVVQNAYENEEDVIIICEDDHEFTERYDSGFLIDRIVKAYALGADVLLGGIANCQMPMKVNENIYWVDDFYCTQFMVVFNKFFSKILLANYREPMTVDGKISSLSCNKLVLYPFISVQRDFGYSDITPRASSEIRPPNLFNETMERLRTLDTKERHFNDTPRIR